MNRKLFIVLTLIAVLVMAVPAFADYKADFNDDYEDAGWEEFVLIGNPNGRYIYPERNRLSFHMGPVDTYLYMIQEDTDTEDSVVEGTFENVFSSDASYGLVCRYHDYGWYEFRIYISGERAGSYAVFKYDQYLKDQGKAPYVLLHPGMDHYNTFDIQLGLNQKNKLKMVCKDDTIRIFINGKEQEPIRNGYLTDSDFEDGTSGFFIQNYSPTYSQIDITKFSAEFEE